LSDRVDTTAAGLSDASSTRAVQSIELAVDGGGSITVYPAVGDLAGEDSDVDYVAAAAMLSRLLTRDAKKFRYCIVDFQAGLTTLLDDVFARIDVPIVVTEADPVSIAAVAYLRRHLEHVKKAEVFGLVNRALPEEGPYFESLTDYAREIRWIGVLPLDQDVRRAFFRRELPLRPNTNDPLAAALVGALRHAAPISKKDLDRAQKWISVSGRSVDDDRAALARLRLQLEDELNLNAYQQERQMLVGRMLQAVAMAVALVGIFIFTGNRSNDFLASLGVASGVAGALAGVAVSFYTSSRRARSRSVDEPRIKAELERVNEQLRVYGVSESQSWVDAARRDLGRPTSYSQ
jgi:cellulose biosynthesis protein BcsQ